MKEVQRGAMGKKEEREKELVAKCAERFGLHIEAIGEVPESYSSQVFVLSLARGEKAVLKIPYNRTKFKRELNTLTMLEDVLPVPRVLDCWEGDGETPPALLLSFLDGEPIQGQIDKDLAWQMGHLLGSMHTIPMPEYSLVSQEKSDWKRSLEIMVSAWIGETKGLFSEKESKDIEQQCKTLLDRLPSPQGPVLIHMDYRPGNILIHNGKIRGLIDFESSRGGEVEIDFSKIKVEVWEQYQGTKETFLAGYGNTGVQHRWEETQDFYDYFMALGAVAWSLRRDQRKATFFYDNLTKIRNWTGAPS